MKTFTEKVRGVVAQIPKGETMSYQAVAQRAGNAHAVMGRACFQFSFRLKIS